MCGKKLHSIRKKKSLSIPFITQCWSWKSGGVSELREDFTAFIPLKVSRTFNSLHNASLDFFHHYCPNFFPCFFSFWACLNLQSRGTARFRRCSMDWGAVQCDIDRHQCAGTWVSEGRCWKSGCRWDHNLIVWSMLDLEEAMLIKKQTNKPTNVWLGMVGEIKTSAQKYVLQFLILTDFNTDWKIRK